MWIASSSSSFVMTSASTFTMIAMLMQSRKAKAKLKQEPNSTLLDVLMLSRSNWCPQTKSGVGQRILAEYDLVVDDDKANSIISDWVNARKFSRMISDAMFVHPFYLMLKKRSS